MEEKKSAKFQEVKEVEGSKANPSGPSSKRQAQSQRQTMSTLINPRSDAEVEEETKTSPMTTKQVTFQNGKNLAVKTEPHSRQSPAASVKSSKKIVIDRRDIKFIE